MRLVEVSEAARLLGVSTRQVQRLVDEGQLLKVARGLVDGDSIDAFHVVRNDAHTRAWSTETAWAAIELLDGGSASWYGASQRSRLQSRLRAIHAVELVSKVRNRADSTSFAAHPSAIARIQKEVLTPKFDRRIFGLAEVQELEGYLATSQLQRVIAKYALVPSADSNLKLRATSMHLDVVAKSVQRAGCIAMLHLAESRHARERDSGLRALEQSLSQLRV